ncbi:MAG: hypothetical protein U1F57_02935 [bacterium]
MTAGTSLSFSASETLLLRFSQTSLAQESRLFSAQAQMDGLVSHFVQEATDWRSMAAMMAGGVAYRLGRMGAMSILGSQRLPLRLLANTIGLANEVTVFEAMNGILRPESTPSTGEGGFWHRWRASFLNFGLLKIGGAAAVGQNVIAQHLFQDTAMVAGNHLTARLGLGPAPEGTLAQQFLHAEATNLQLGVGMGFAHFVMPGIHAFESGLETPEAPLPLRSLEGPQEGFQPATGSLEISSTHENPSEVVNAPSQVWMSSIKDPTQENNALPRPLSEASTKTPVRPEIPLPGERWGEYLTRLEITRGELSAADLGVTGATIFHWGSKGKEGERPHVPGDLHLLLGVLRYLNGGSRGFEIDPFDALRLTHPEQFRGFEPDENGDLILRFPQEMKELDYAHLNLETLLRGRLQATERATDGDLARSWKVSENTASEYRQGRTRKMHLENLDRLAEALSTNGEQREEIHRFLTFLRYRNYFETTMPIVGADGESLHAPSEKPSRYRIVLAPSGETLRSLDTTRRIPFEREPFASAVDGTVDEAFRLLDGRMREFELTGMEEIPLPSGEITRENLSGRLEEFRKSHAEHASLLANLRQNPAWVSPHRVRAMQNFYREFFRFFEATYVHARTRGEIRLKNQTIRYEGISPTSSQPLGVLFAPADPLSAEIRATVVLGDLASRSGEFSPAQFQEIVRLRILRSLMTERYLLLPGGTHPKFHRNLMESFLNSHGLPLPSPETWQRFERMEREGASWSAPVIDPSSRLLFHRLTRGNSEPALPAHASVNWRRDLAFFAGEENLGERTVPFISAFEHYFANVRHPFLRFEGEKLDEAIVRNLPPTSNFEPSALRAPLLKFMRRVGLPTGENGQAAPLSLEGFSDAVFAHYLHQFYRLHPFTTRGGLVNDAALIHQILEERLPSFPHFERENVLRQLDQRITEYNSRNPVLRIYGLEARRTNDSDPFLPQGLERWVQGRIGEYLRQFPEAEGTLFEPLLYAALPPLLKTLETGERPAPAQIEHSLREAQERLSELQIVAEDSPYALDLLRVLVNQIHLHERSMEALSWLIPEFVSLHRYHSGFHDSAQLGRDLQRIFREHTFSHLFRPEPLPLRALILRTVGDRFAPYDSIREDVAKGYEVIYQELLNHFSHRYRSLEENFTLAVDAAVTHRETAQFWKDFSDCARVDQKDLTDSHAVVLRLRDLERFFDHFLHRPERLLSERILEAIESWETVSEAQASSEEGEAPVAIAEAVAPNTEVFPVENPPSLPASLFDRLGALPEIRGDGPPLQGAKAARAMNRFITRREIPREAEKELVRAARQHMTEKDMSGKSFLDLISEKFDARGFVEGKPAPFAEDVQKCRQEIEDLLIPLFERQTEIYLKHREAILASPEISFSDAEQAPLDLSRPLPALREKVEREMPELDFQRTDAQIEKGIPILLERFRGFAEIELPQLSYLFLKLSYLPVNLLTRDQGAPRDVPAIFRELWDAGLAAAQGVSLPHYLHQRTRELTRIYEKARGEYLRSLSASPEKLQALLSAFPEIRGMNDRGPLLPDFLQNVPTLRIPGMETTVKAAHRLLRLEEGHPARNAFLQMLFTVPAGENPAGLSHRILTFYLKNRSGVWNTPLRDMPYLEESWREDERILGDLWELPHFQPSSEEDIKNERAYLIELWRKPSPTEDDLRTRKQTSFMVYFSISLMQLIMATKDQKHAASQFSRAYYPLCGRLMYLGVSPSLLLPAFRNRLIAAYQGERRKFLNGLNYPAILASLPEIERIPMGALQMFENRYRDAPGFRGRSENSLYFSLLLTLQLLKKADLLDLPNMNKEIELYQKNARQGLQSLAIFYLEHRQALLPQLERMEVNHDDHFNDLLADLFGRRLPH